MNLRHLMRMSKWSRNPPSEKMVKLVLAVIVLGLLLVLVEKFFGWPDALTVNGLPRNPARF